MFGVEIGSSPITEDYHLNAERLRELIISIKGGD